MCPIDSTRIYSFSTSPYSSAQLAPAPTGTFQWNHDGSLRLCLECHPLLSKKCPACPRFALARGLWIEPQPEELQTLIMPERLIARTFSRTYITCDHDGRPRGQCTLNADATSRGLTYACWQLQPPHATTNSCSLRSLVDLLPHLWIASPPDVLSVRRHIVS